MKGTHNTYCTPEFLDAIIKGRKKDFSYSIAYNMIYKLSNVYVDMSKEELKELIKKDDNYARLNKRENKSLNPKEWIEKFSPCNVLCDDVFLINEGEIKDYKKVRKEYGCLIIANEPNDLKSFERYIKEHTFNLVPKSEKIDDPTIKSHDSWTQFFEEFKMTPLNAVVITDNFMFGSKFDERKVNSLFSILKAIAPKDLKQDFHITIFLNNNPDRNGLCPLKKDKAELLIQEIKALNLCESTKVTIVAHTIKSTTHDRELITNYYYMFSGIGFSVVDNNGVREIAKGQVQHIFCGMDSNVTVKQLQAEVAMWLKPIFNGEKGGDANYSYIVGDKVNRLFS